MGGSSGEWQEIVGCLGAISRQGYKGLRSEGLAMYSGLCTSALNINLVRQAYLLERSFQILNHLAFSSTFLPIWVTDVYGFPANSNKGFPIFSVNLRGSLDTLRLFLIHSHRFVPDAKEMVWDEILGTVAWKDILF